MFCPNCGKELPDGAQFCTQCGTAILSKPQQSSESEPSAFTQDHNKFQQGSTILQKKSSNSWKVIIGAIGAAIILIAIIFIVRANNEKNMIRQIPWLVCDDETTDTITSYYEDYLGTSLTVGCDAEDFSVKQGSDSNTFDIVGKIEVTDISQDSRPTYDVNVTGTATTNFFRTKCSFSYQLQYQTPEIQTPEIQTPESQTPEDSSIIPIETLYQAFSSNPVSANNTYANQYLNVSGKIYDISYGTFTDIVNVNLRYNDGLDLMDAKFQFDPSDESLNNLIIGENIVLTGYLKPDGDMTWGLTFANASVYKSGSNTNNFPPEFTPIEGYSDILGEYIDEYGRVLVVSVATGEGVNYFINIYANQSDADNYASPLLEATRGTLNYRNGYMIIAFEDSSGNGLYFERDNFIEDNYTLYVHGDPYVGGCNVEPYLGTTFYMTEQYIDPMT